jgi:hypothetical protein
MEGWIKLHRKLLSWEWWDDSKTVHLFIHLLLKANHKANKWRGIELSRGQLVVGLNSLSEQTGISVQSLRTCLKRLEDSGSINRQSNNQRSIITISEYEQYQHDDSETNKQNNKQSTSNQQADNKQSTTNKNVKNVNNAKKFKPPSVVEVEEYCQKRENGISSQAFIDHYTSNGWMRGKTKITDWKAAVRTWEHRQKQEPKPQTKKYREL